MIRMLEGIYEAKKSFTTLYVNWTIVKILTSYILYLFMQLFRHFLFV